MPRRKFESEETLRTCVICGQEHDASAFVSVKFVKQISGGIETELRLLCHYCVLAIHTSAPRLVTELPGEIMIGRAEALLKREKNKPVEP